MQNNIEKETYKIIEKIAPSIFLDSRTVEFETTEIIGYSLLFVFAKLTDDKIFIEQYKINHINNDEIKEHELIYTIDKENKNAKLLNIHMLNENQYYKPSHGDYELQKCFNKVLLADSIENFNPQSILKKQA